ncbi:MAG: cupredoxin family copper-binding protein [Gemmatimonadota bacterium]
MDPARLNPGILSRAAAGWGLFALAVAAPAVAIAQPVTDRSPNLNGTWISSPRVLHFQLAHRFEVAGGDTDVTDIFGDGKIVNYPTFEFSYGLVDRVMVGFRYSSNSLIAGSFNEWQPYAKTALIPNRGGSRPSLALTGAWNSAAESFDGELALQSNPGRFVLLGAVRGFSNGFERPGAEGFSAVALAAGAGVRLTRYITLSADVADVVTEPGLSTAWSASLGIGIPYTPHSLSIVATNVSSGTMEGQSVGIDGATYWGFEFTVPFSGFARWGKIFDPASSGSAAALADEAAAGESRRVVEIEIRGMKFDEAEIEIPAGTTVRWVNRDPVAHTSTADGDASGDQPAWSSPSLGPGDVYEYTFETPGQFTYHCVPHPFMRGAITVR